MQKAESVLKCPEHAVQELAELAGDAAPGSLEHLANTLEGHAEEVSLISQALEDKAPLLVVQDLQVGRLGASKDVMQAWLEPSCAWCRCLQAIAWDPVT